MAAKNDVTSMDSAATSSSQAFATVTSGYYRSPDPHMAVLALRHLLGMVAASHAEVAGDRAAARANLERFGSVLYLFGRIAQVSAEARAGFGPVLREIGEPLEGILRAILEGRSPSALDLSVEGPQHLDVLWAEFFVTGSPDAVLRIVGTLDREDRVRGHVDRWLNAGSFFDRGKRRVTAAALREAGLDLDLDAKAILTDADLDCLCFSIAERRIPIFKLLPFALSQEDLRILATKGSALWSLRLNATEHPRVAEICRAERDRPGGAARLRLTEPIEGRPFAL
jgi:hypothetical protein